MSDSRIPAQPQAIAYTSLIVAAKRAIETSREDRLFDDPYAAMLAADEIPVLLDRWRKLDGETAQISRKRTRFIAIRTRFYDDFLMSAQSQIAQVVILGAGMDARAFRLPWLPHIHLYEIDRPEVLQYKEAVLKAVPARCDRTPITADLTADWSRALQQHGFRADVPSLWLLEGVLMYLPETAVHQLLQTITSLSSIGSYLGADWVSVKSIEVGASARAADRGRVVRHWQFGSDRPEDLLAEYGWQASVVQPGDAGVNFGRYREKPPTRGIPGTRHVFLTTATKGQSSPTPAPVPST
jgi:methyltransferase (TIGR00027 family)